MGVCNFCDLAYSKLWKAQHNLVNSRKQLGRMWAGCSPLKNLRDTFLQQMLILMNHLIQK